MVNEEENLNNEENNKEEIVVVDEKDKKENEEENNEEFKQEDLYVIEEPDQQEGEEIILNNGSPSIITPNIGIPEFKPEVKETNVITTGEAPTEKIKNVNVKTSKPKYNNELITAENFNTLELPGNTFLEIKDYHVSAESDDEIIANFLDGDKARFDRDFFLENVTKGKAIDYSNWEIYEDSDGTPLYSSMQDMIDSYAEEGIMQTHVPFAKGKAPFETQEEFNNFINSIDFNETVIDEQTGQEIPIWEDQGYNSADEYKQATIKIWEGSIGFPGIAYDFDRGINYNIPEITVFEKIDFSKAIIKYEERAKNDLKSTILKEDSKWHDGYIINSGESQSLKFINKSLNKFGVNAVHGTNTWDDWVRIELPDGSTFKLPVDHGDKKVAKKEWAKALKTIANYSTKYKHGHPFALTMPANKREKNLFYNNQETDVYKIIQYDEEKFGRYFKKLFPGLNNLGNERGIGDAYQFALPHRGTDGVWRTQNVDIDLQPVFTEGTDITGAFAGGTVDRGKLLQMISVAKDYNTNPYKWATYTDWSPNYQSSEVQSEGSLGDAKKGVGNKENLFEIYKKAANLDITFKDGVYTVKKEGKLLFEGTSVYNADVFTSEGTAISKFVKKNISSSEGSYNPNIQDFIFNYNFTDEELAQLQYERGNIIKKSIGNSKNTDLELFVFRNPELQNTISAYGKVNLFKIQAGNDSDKKLIEKLEKEIPEKEKEFEKTFKTLQDEANELLKLHGGKVEFIEDMNQYIIDLNTDDSEALNQAMKLAAKINEAHTSAIDYSNNIESIAAELQTNAVTRGDLANVATDYVEAANKSYNGTDQFLQRANNSVLGVLNSFRGVWNPQAAAKYDKVLESRINYQFGRSDLTYKDLFTGRGGMYVSNMFADNFGTLGLGIVTGGTSGYFQLGANATKLAVSSVYSISAIGDTGIDYQHRENDAHHTKEVLMPKLEKLYAENKITKEVYNKTKSQYAQQIQDGNISLSDHILGRVINGGSMFLGVRYGSAPIFSKFNKNLRASVFGNSVTNKVQNHVFGNIRAARNFGNSFLKGGFGEFKEELIQEGGSQTSDKILFGKNYDPTVIPELLSASYIMGGTMNIGGDAYQNITTPFATSSLFKTEISQITKDLIKISKEIDNIDFKGPNSDALLNIKLDKRAQILKNQNITNNKLELTALSVPPSGLKTILETHAFIEQKLHEAGVDPRLDDNIKIEKVNDYVAELADINEKEANNFKKEFNEALEAKNNAISSATDLDQTIKKVYGKKAETKLKELIEKNPNLAKETKDNQAVEVHIAIKKDLEDAAIGRGKGNPYVVQQINNAIFGGKRPANPTKEQIQTENDHYAHVGRLINADIEKAIIINKKSDAAAEQILQDARLKDLKITVAENDGVLQEKVIEAYDNIAAIEINKVEKEKITREQKDSKIQKIKHDMNVRIQQGVDGLRNNDLNAFIVGGQYIVKDKVAAEAAIEDGFLLASTAIEHEISHAIDHLAFDQAGITNYGKNLRNYMKKNFPKAHAEAERIQSVIGNYDSITGEMPAGEDTFYDEYSKEVQSYFRLNEDAKNELLKLSSSVPNAFRSLINRGYEINNGRDAAVYLGSFLRGFENGEIGKLQKKRIDYRKRKGIKTKVVDTKKSKSNVQNILNDYGGKNASKTDIRKMVNETLTKTPQGQETFDITKSRFGQEINPITEAITKRLYDKIPTDATRAAGLSRADYKNALVSEAATMTQQEYDPTKQDLDKFISNRLNLRAESLAKRLGVEEKILKDVDFIKETDIETVAETAVETDVSEARVLGNFDIALEDGMVDAEIVAEVESLIEQNPPDLKQRFEKLVLTDIRKNLDNSIGKIAKNKETGIVGPTPEYEAFIRDEFNETINSLGIETIRTAYKPFFKQEKIGRKDYKNIDETTGKVSNYRKDVFINTASKPDYIKYFTQGKPNVLRERRTGLIRRISRRKAEVAVDNYIERNSNNMDAITDAKLRGLTRTAKNINQEQTSFDAVKYSQQVKQDIEKYITFKKPDGTPLFQSKGHALEQVILDRIRSYGLPTNILKVAVDYATEQGGLADINLEVFGKPLRVEVKLDEKVPMGSVSVSSYDLNYRNFKLAESNIRLPFRKMLDLVHNDIVTLRDAYNQKIQVYNQQNGTNEPLMSDNPIGHKMVESVYNDLKKERAAIFTNSTFVTPNAQPLIDHYLNKKAGAVEAIEIFGKGLYSFVPDSPLGKNVPHILDMARVKTGIRVMNSGRLRSKGKVITNKAGDGYIRMSLQFQNTLEANSLKAPKNPVSLTSKQDMMLGLGVPVKENVLSDLTKASRNARTTIKYHDNPRGMSTFDFDETLIIDGENFIVAKDPATGETTNISSADWPIQGPRLAEQGYEFDFSDFVNVRGGVDGPLLQKMRDQITKFGPKNVFVLTARPQASADAIHGWLKSKNINIPFENITGLADSTGAAKAEWMLQKFSEGYNDMYFVDDALPNVEAVKDALDQLDIKSKVQQAKVKFSQNIDTDFNKILEEVTGIEAEKRFSDVKARKRGAGKGKFRFFIPPSHEDFVGLLYNFMGKGAKGDSHRNFFEQALVKPLNRGYRELDTAKQAIANDYKQLNKQFPDVKNKLKKKTPDGDFTYEDAIRVYLWNKHAYDVPGLSNTDKTNLSDIVLSDPELRAYAETLNTISKQDTYVDPGEGWEGGNIRIDLMDATGRVGRAEYFTEFNENAEIMFSKENLNKIEAAYGKSVRSALEDMLHRIKTGVNRPKGQSATVNKFMNYLNGSVGSVMFFNTRSAILQQMSIVNYINFADNNILAAAKAFANQKQYWQDFAFIFNSDMLKQRRGGIGTDINGAELAQAVARAGDKGIVNQSKIVIGKLLQLGFLPTQIGDNIAIATGGATFYRNRINKYKKEGFSNKEAEAKAFTDFQDITQSTQQSSRPDMTSKQQASWIGKLVLNFQNITSQYNRIMKKSASDIYNRRITPPNTTQLQSDLSNLSRILYYGGIQNLVFYGLQTALFAVMFDEDEDEDKILNKKERVINGTLDSLLRGTGIYGATVSTLKNMYIKYQGQRDKGYNKDESAVLMEMLNFSPVVGIKARKIVNAEKTLNYNKDIIKEMDTFDIDNPAWSASTNYIEAITNFPANRLLQKSINVRNSLDNQYTTFQRAMFFAGYTTWSLGIGDTKEMIEIKENIKEKKKIKKEEDKKLKKEQEIREANPDLSEEEIQIKIKSKEMFSLNKGEQQKLLKDLGLSDEEILGLKKEQDRADKIAELYKDNSELIDDFMLNPDSIEIKAPKKPKTQKKKTSKKKTFKRKSF